MRFKIKSFVLKLAVLVAVAGSFGVVNVLRPANCNIVFAEGGNDEDTQLVDDDDDDDEEAAGETNDDDDDDYDDENEEDDVDDIDEKDMLASLAQANAKMGMKQSYFDVFLNRQTSLNKLIRRYATVSRVGTGFSEGFKRSLKQLVERQDNGHVVIKNSVTAALNMLKSEYVYCKFLDKKIGVLEKEIKDLSVKREKAPKREKMRFSRQIKRKRWVLKPLLKIREFLTDWIKIFLSKEEQKKFGLESGKDGLGFVLRNELVEMEKEILQKEEEGSKFVINAGKFNKFKKNMMTLDKDLLSILKSLKKFLEDNNMEEVKDELEYRKKRKEDLKNNNKKKLREMFSKKKRTSRDAKKSGARGKFSVR